MVLLVPKLVPKLTTARGHMLSPELNATQIGTVAEQLVRYKLLRWGYEAIPVEQGNPYDLVVITGIRPLRIQVKGTSAPDTRRPHAYRFATKQGSRTVKRYKACDIDMFAFVALDIERVLFYPFVDTSCKRVGTSKFTTTSPRKQFIGLVDKILAN